MWKEKNNLTWRSITTIVDIDTGEILTKDILDRKEYIKQFTEKTTEYGDPRYKNARNINRYTIGVRRNDQYSLF